MLIPLSQSRQHDLLRLVQDVKVGVGGADLLVAEQQLRLAQRVTDQQPLDLLTAQRRPLLAPQRSDGLLQQQPEHVNRENVPQGVWRYRQVQSEPGAPLVRPLERGLPGLTPQRATILTEPQPQRLTWPPRGIARTSRRRSSIVIREYGLARHSPASVEGLAARTAHRQNIPGLGIDTSGQLALYQLITLDIQVAM